jgi:4'-phosphopantetheinyl transferase EntD
VKHDPSLPIESDRIVREVFSIDANTVCVAGRIADYTGDLAEADRLRISNSVNERRQEFSTGRYFAKHALSFLGFRSSDPLGLDGRRPVWPKGVTGSISHSDTLAFVIVSNHPWLKGLGVDIEPATAPPPATDRLVFTRTELDRISDENRLFATRLFSAKEAVFKAVNPIAKKMIGFQDVELEFGDAASCFSARYTGANRSNRIMQRGLGVSTVYRAHIISSFFIS